jgi:hypothetical protein
MLPRSENDLRRSVVGGVAAGLAAAALLTAMMTIMSLARGADIWFGMKGAAAPILGERAMQPGFDFFAVWLGLMCHFAVSVAWAVPFAMLFSHLGRLATIAAGAAWGIVVWLGMFYVVLPWVGLGEMRHGAPLSRAILYHLFFGISVAIAYLAFQREERRIYRRIPELA